MEHLLHAKFGIPCDTPLQLFINCSPVTLSVRGTVLFCESTTFFCNLQLSEDVFFNAGAIFKKDSIIKLNCSSIIMWQEIDEVQTSQIKKQQEPTVIRVPILATRDTQVSQEIVPSRMASRKF